MRQRGQILPLMRTTVQNYWTLLFVPPSQQLVSAATTATTTMRCTLVFVLLCTLWHLCAADCVRNGTSLNCLISATSAASDFATVSGFSTSTTISRYSLRFSSTDINTLRGTTIKNAQQVIITSDLPTDKISFTSTVKRPLFEISNVTLLDISNLKFSKIVSNTNGSAMHVQRIGNLSITNCDFEENSAAENGGAIYAVRVDRFLLSRSRFASNSILRMNVGLRDFANDFKETDVISFAESEFIGNVPSPKHMLISQERFLLNIFAYSAVDSSFGGAISMEQVRNASFDLTVFTGNAASYGGALRVKNSVLSMTDCTMKRTRQTRKEVQFILKIPKSKPFEPIMFPTFAMAFDVELFMKRTGIDLLKHSHS